MLKVEIFCLTDPSLRCSLFGSFVNLSDGISLSVVYGLPFSDLFLWNEVLQALLTSLFFVISNPLSM